MPSQKNIEKTQTLKTNLEKAKAVILSDFSGLSVKKQVELRSRVKESGGELTVAKNNLFRMALKELNKDLSPELDQALNGPTAFLFAYEDEIDPLKALVNFSKENALPKTKIGLLLQPQDRIISLQEIETLSQLPNREQLLLALIGNLKAPAYRLVNALSGNLRKLTLLINEIKKQNTAN